MGRPTIQHSQSFMSVQISQEPDQKTTELDLDVFSKLEMERESVSNYSESSLASSIRSLDQHCSTVQFSTVQVREYALTIGDHPYCRSGCPLSLDWDYETRESVDVDKFEAERSPKRRSRQELITTWDERKAMLQNIHSDDDLRRSARKLQRARCSARFQKRSVQKSFFESK